MAYIVRYSHPALGRRVSSVWQLRSDADAYASTKPVDWRAEVVQVDRVPDIFRHCGPADDRRNPSQAVGGRCSWCQKLLTREDARQAAVS